MSALKSRLYRLLRVSERYTKTDMVYLASGGFWLSLTQVVLLTTGLLLTFVLANYLSKEEYGTYRLIIAALGIAGTCTLPGINASLSRAVARGERHILISATKSRVLWSLGASFICLGLALLNYLYGTADLMVAFVLLALFIPLFDTFTTAVSYLQGKKEFKRSGVLTMVPAILGTGLSAAAAVISGSFLIVLVTYLATYSATRYLAYAQVSRTERVSSEPSSSEESHAISYGKHLSIMGALPAIAANVDKVLLFYLLGPASVAVYAIATTIPDQIKNAFKNLVPLTGPKFAPLSHESIRATRLAIYRYTFLIGAVAGLGALFYSIVAPVIFSLLFPAYTEAVAYSQVFAFSVIVSAAFVPLSVLQAQERTRELYRIHTASPIIQVLLYVIFIPFLGLWGAIIAWTLGRVFNLAYTVMLFRSVYSRVQ